MYTFFCGFCGSKCEIPKPVSPSYWGCDPACYLRWFAYFTTLGRAKIRNEAR